MVASLVETVEPWCMRWKVEGLCSWTADCRLQAVRLEMVVLGGWVGRVSVMSR